MAQGVVTTVDNTNRRIGAAQSYAHVEVLIDDKPMHLLFTAAEIDRALRRARLNAEDWPMPEPGAIQRALDWLRGKKGK
jgi:hypothetical protein